MTETTNLSVWIDRDLKEGNSWGVENYGEWR